MKRLNRCLLIMLAAVVSPSSVPAQNDSADLPPSPFSLPASTVPQSAWYSRDASRALELHAATTNAAAKKLLGDIRDMKSKLATLESDAWQKDPLLLTCDQFIEKTHDWVMARHHAEMEADMRYFLSTNDTATVESRRRLESDLTRMMEMILFHELGANTNFAPLQKSLYKILEAAFKQNTNATSGPDLFVYWRFDRFIGYADTNRPARDHSYTNLQAQIGRRYDLLVAGLAKIQQEKNIPAEAVAGLKYGDLYRTLDGMCEVYLEVRTPPELQKLREDLRRKIIDLSWADK